MSKIIWTLPKQIRPVQNDWYSTKMILTVQNHFGPIVAPHKVAPIFVFGVRDIRSSPYTPF